jgi:hypothetical protein
MFTMNSFFIAFIANLPTKRKLTQIVPENRTNELSKESKLHNFSPKLLKFFLSAYPY